MTIELKKANAPQLQKFIDLLKPISIGCGVVAIAGLSIYPIIHNKTVEKAESKVEQKSTSLPPANYTIIMGEGNSKVVLRFHNQKSELILNNITSEEYNCLLNGGGVNCVLAEAYQPKSEVVGKQTETNTKAEINHQQYSIKSIRIPKDTMDIIVVVGGVILGLLLIEKVRPK